MGLGIFRLVIINLRTTTAKLRFQREEYYTAHLFLLPSFLRFFPYPSHSLRTRTLSRLLLGFRRSHGSCVEAVEGHAPQELAPQDSPPLRHCRRGHLPFSFPQLFCSSQFQPSLSFACFSITCSLLSHSISVVF